MDDQINESNVLLLFLVRKRQPSRRGLHNLLIILLLIKSLLETAAHTLDPR